jgi:hypothetical protein
MSVKIFNSLPKFLVDLLEDETMFVERLKEILIHNAFYSVDEFLNYCQKKYEQYHVCIYFQTNLALHCINIRQGNHLHSPLVHRSAVQKGIMYSAIKVFSKLPVCIRQFQYDEVQFKKSLNSVFLYFFFLIH